MASGTLYGDVFDVPIAVNLALQLATYLTAGTFGSVVNALAGFLGGTARYFGGPATNDTPAYVWAQNGGQVIVLISGTANLNQATQLANGWFGTGPDPIQQPVNEYSYGIAGTIITAYNASSFPKPKQVLVCGHSLGGAVAEDLALALITQDNPDLVQIITFGAPATMNAAKCARLSVVPTARWMCSDDPVALLPPTFDLVPALLFVCSSRVLQRLANFLQPAGGIQVDTVGNISTQEIPTVASINFGASLAAWLLAIDTAQVSPHSPITYASRLNMWLTANPSRVIPTVRGSSAETLDVTARNEIARQQQVTHHAIGRLAEQQNVPQVTIPPDRLFQAVRLGRTWAVQFQGDIVFVCGERRSARSVARTWNLALRSAQHQAIVDEVNLSTQLEDYLAAAATSGAGFIPIMNTQLPS